MIYHIDENQNYGLNAMSGGFVNDDDDHKLVDIEEADGYDDLDFEYKKNGFFGRVVPIQNMTNSQSLLSIIQTALQTFKQEEYAS